MSQILSDEMRFKLMRLLQDNPEMSQRQAARELGVSVGKVNYCVQALVGRGLVKARRFKNSRNKSGYLYLLTPRGLEEKSTLTVRFLQMKMREYDVLRAEIEQISEEVDRAKRESLGAPASEGRREGRPAGSRSQG